jgi:peptidoglycan hydrolase-like protein with peptidoglycan-binding domain
MNTHSPFVIEPFLARGHQADCRCAQCRHNGLAQEFLPLFAENVPARGSQYMFEVAPFDGLSPTAANNRPLGNEAIDAQVGEWGRRGQPTRRGAQPSQRPAPPRRQPPRRLQRRARRPFPLFATDPTTVAAQGSEQVRWAQNALNQIMDLDLPVNGVMDRATRSAVRSFQRNQSLPASGILGPETVPALRAAFGSHSAGVDSGGEYDEIEIGPLDTTLEWFGPYKQKEAMDQATQRKLGGGVYIVLGLLDNEKDKIPEVDEKDIILIGKQKQKYRILKVGKTESLERRMYEYRNGLKYKKNNVEFGVEKLMFYLGTIQAVDPFAQTERALARLLIRSGAPLPGSRKVGNQDVKGRVVVRNFLPAALWDKLQKNPLPEADRKKLQTAVSGTGLDLKPAQFSSWEVL